MSGADPYLDASFECYEEEIDRQAAASGRTRSLGKTLLPMLLRVGDLDWDPGEIPDLEVTSQIGDVVACNGSRDSVEALERHPAVLAIEGSRRASAPDSDKAIKFIRADVVQKRSGCSENGDCALIAVIDDGIDVLHKAFLDDHGQTRIVAIWDQTEKSNSPPTFKGKKRKGREHTQDLINSYIAAQKVPEALGRNLDGHGTHVASIAAGRRAGKFSGGVAPESKIVVVIPKLRVDPSDTFSLGYSTSHVEALEYVDCIAKDLGLPVVVNLSQGMNMGAHDGTSIVELAFDNFCSGGRRPGRVVVKSAGNERTEGIHARLKIAAGSIEHFTWTSSNVFRARDDVEVWFKSCDELHFRLFEPGGKPSALVSKDEHKRGKFPGGNKYLIQYQRFHPDNGDSRLLVTITPGGAPSIAPGPWRLDIEGVEVRDGVVHAWMERDTERAIQFDTHLNEESTLSIPGTARTVIAVASVRPSEPFEVAGYSSYGPTRDGRYKPDVAAPGEDISAAQAGTASDVIAMSGTSMAAPHVTGAIALLLSQSAKRCAAAKGLKPLNAAQVRAGLSQMTKKFTGQWTPGLGYGVIDVEKLLDAFRESATG